MITVYNVSKEFKIAYKGSEINRINTSKGEASTLKAVREVSFYIEQGETVGLLGPNGAGKSTLFKLLSGMLQPSEGILRVSGIDPCRRKVENALKIGTVFSQQSQLSSELPLLTSFELKKYMHKIPNYIYYENLDLFSRMLDLKPMLNVPPQKLSAGERIKADFAYSMLHNPEILYLDEPANGLDLSVKEKLLGFIRQINKERNTTVILTTHNVMDIEKVCKRALVMDKGRLIYNGGMKQMKDFYDLEHTLELEFDCGKLPDLQDLPIKKYSIDNNRISIVYDNRIINSAIILSLVLKQCPIKSINIAEPKLSDIILKMYENLQT